MYTYNATTGVQYSTPDLRRAPRMDRLVLHNTAGTATNYWDFKRMVAEANWNSWQPTISDSNYTIYVDNSGTIRVETQKGDYVCEESDELYKDGAPSEDCSINDMIDSAVEMSRRDCA